MGRRRTYLDEVVAALEVMKTSSFQRHSSGSSLSSKMMTKSQQVLRMRSPPGLRKSLLMEEPSLVWKPSISSENWPRSMATRCSQWTGPPLATISDRLTPTTMESSTLLRLRLPCEKPENWHKLFDFCNIC